MIIPEDGSLPQITRKGFAAFNNVMLIKVPEKLKKPGDTSFQLATLDRSKKGEKWPADIYVDSLINAPKETENNSQKSVGKQGKFNPKKFKTFTRKFSHFSENNQNQGINSSKPPIVSPNNTNFNHHFIPNAFQDHQVSLRRFDDNHVQCNERTFNGDPHTYRYPNNFSNDHQPYGGRDNLLGEGTSSNPLANGYGVQNQIINATISREPTMGDRSFNMDFNFRGHPPLYPNTYVPNPQENNFNRAGISNPNFGEMGRNVDDPFIQNIPDAYNTNNYNEVPRNFNFERETFPFHNSNRPEPNFINNNFERPTYRHDSGLNSSFNAGNNPPLLPLPPHLACEGFGKDQFQNNSNRRNPSYDQKNWRNRNQPNSHYRRGGNAYKSRRGRDASNNNKISKGNNRRANNRYQRKKPS